MHFRPEGRKPAMKRYWVCLPVTAMNQRRRAVVDSRSSGSPAIQLANYVWEGNFASCENRISRLKIEGHMPTIDLTSDQVIELMQQMPVQERQKALAVLVQGLVSGEKERNESLAHGIREACEARGVQWDTMTDNGRETFIDDLLHSVATYRSNG